MCARISFSVDSLSPSLLLSSIRSNVFVFLSKLNLSTISLDDLLYLLRKFLHYLFRSLVYTSKIVYYLLAPGLVLEIMFRHWVALVCMYGGVYFIKPCIVPVVRLITEYAASFFHTLGDSYYFRHKELEEAMHDAVTYDAWSASAKELDVLEGKAIWKESNEYNEDLFDVKKIKHHLAWLRGLVDSGDIKGTMFYLRSRLVRNFGGIGNKKLYTYLRCGTKSLIEEYNNEVVRALQLICIENSAVPALEKLDFFNETRHSYGRSALFLSGGAGFGFYHVGFVRALIRANLLPRVISGSSAGSIVTACLGTRTDAEMLDIEQPGKFDLTFFPSEMGSTYEVLQSALQHGSLLDINVLKQCIRSNIPDLTFKEAHERTGRIINISISPLDGDKAISHCLNYLSAPNVLIWSAVMASCAVPLIFSPVELMCKDSHGNTVPYYAEGDIRFADGSIYSDIPVRRLAELFNVNHCIVSQVNPHVIPYVLPDSLIQTGSFFEPIFKLLRYLGREFKQKMINLYDLGIPLPDIWCDLMLQKYMGDITLVPAPAFLEYFQLFSNMPHTYFVKCARSSELACWPKLAQISSRCQIEFTLDECVRRTRGMLLISEIKRAKKQDAPNSQLLKLLDTKIGSWADQQFRKVQRDFEAICTPVNYFQCDEPEGLDEYAWENKSFEISPFKLSQSQNVSNATSPQVSQRRSPCAPPLVLSVVPPPNSQTNEIFTVPKTPAATNLFPTSRDVIKSEEVEEYCEVVKSSHFPPFRAVLPREITAEQLRDEIAPLEYCALDKSKISFQISRVDSKLKLPRVESKPLFKKS